MITNTQPNGQLINTDSQIPELQLRDKDGRQIISKYIYRKGNIGATIRAHIS